MRFLVVVLLAALVARFERGRLSSRLGGVQRALESSGAPLQRDVRRARVLGHHRHGVRRLLRLPVEHRGETRLVRRALTRGAAAVDQLLPFRRRQHL